MHTRTAFAAPAAPAPAASPLPVMPPANVRKKKRQRKVTLYAGHDDLITQNIEALGADDISGALRTLVVEGMRAKGMLPAFSAPLGGGKPDGNGPNAPGLRLAA